MDGGKYLGEGNYGCAFRPALPCRSETPIGPGPAAGPAPTAPTRARTRARAAANATISKVFKRSRDLRDEVNTVKDVAHIDPDQKYFVYARTACETTPADLRKDPEYRSCSLVRGSQRRAFPTLKIPFGGVALDEVLGPSGRAPPRAFRAPDPLSALMTALRPVFLGIGRLADAGILHHDIKMNNILYDDRTRECRLIDFGLSIPSRGALTADGNPFLYSEYIFHPPEYRVAAAADIDPHDPIAAALATDFAVLKVGIPGLKGARARERETLRDRLFNPAYTYWTRETYADAFVHYALAAAPGRARTADDRADVWAIGVTLLFILHRVWPTRTTPLPDAFRAALTHMLHPDPRKRLHPKKLPAAFAPWILGESHTISPPTTSLTAPPTVPPPAAPPTAALAVPPRSASPKKLLKKTTLALASIAL